MNDVFFVRCIQAFGGLNSDLKEFIEGVDAKIPKRPALGNVK
jgi:hypothetical protein